MASKTIDDALEGKGSVQMTQRDPAASNAPNMPIAMPLPNEMTPRSGVRALESVSARMPARRHVPPPPRPEVKSSPRAVAHPELPQAALIPTKPPPQARAKAPEIPPEQPEEETPEKTQIFRPNLSDPNLRRSLAPTSPPPTGLAPKDILFPKGPKLPTDMTRAVPGNAPNDDAVMSVAEERTCTYNAETLEKLLHGKDRASDHEAAQEGDPASKSASSAADDVTRVGAVPIEALVAAQAKSSNAGVGHEDVTRIYEMVGAPSNNHGESTSPGARLRLSPEQLGPTIVINADQPSKSHWGRSIALLVCAAVVSLGWAYRVPVSSQVNKLQASLMRGIGRSAAQAKPIPATPVPSVEISISVSPANAVLTIDGAVVTNPYVVHRIADRTSHAIVAEADGHVPLRRTLQFERDLTVVLSLARVAEPTRVEAATAAPTVPASPAAARHNRVTRTKRAEVTESASPGSTPAEASSGGCKVPYTVDAAGIKTYKPECL